MPEGDSVAKLARRLSAALAGRTIERFTSTFPALAHADPPLEGARIEAVTARGKHLLIALADGRVLRTHQLMHGRWRLIRRDRHAPDERMRIETGGVAAVAQHLTVAELTDARGLARGPAGKLGPDLTHDDVDEESAAARLAAQGSRPIAAALLDQRVLAGVGNVIRSEALFLAGVDPASPAAAVPAGKLRALVHHARRILTLNAARAGPRVTRGSLDPRAGLWVYGRTGKPCRRCATPVEVRRDPMDARRVYLCPACQRGSTGATR